MGDNMFGELKYIKEEQREDYINNVKGKYEVRLLPGLFPKQIKLKDGNEYVIVNTAPNRTFNIVSRMSKIMMSPINIGEKVSINNFGGEIILECSDIPFSDFNFFSNFINSIEANKLTIIDYHVISVGKYRKLNFDFTDFKNIRFIGLSAITNNCFSFKAEQLTFIDSYVETIQGDLRIIKCDDLKLENTTFDTTYGNTILGANSINMDKSIIVNKTNSVKFLSIRETFIESHVWDQSKNDFSKVMIKNYH